MFRYFNCRLVSYRVTDLVRYEKIVTESKSLFIEEKGFTILEETSPEKTRIFFKNLIQSPFIPFVRSHITKDLDYQYSKMQNYFDQLAIEMQDFDCQNM